jgi:precorrin-2 dehydrogenase / sirohydrochlorin ferrochelatase
LQEALPGSLNEILDKLQLIRDRIKGDFSEKVKQLNQITDVLVKKD